MMFSISLRPLGSRKPKMEFLEILRSRGLKWVTDPKLLLRP